MGKEEAMVEQGRWALAFWRACKAFGHPFGRLSELEVGRLAVNAKDLDEKGWLIYLNGAMAVLGIQPLDGIYSEGSFTLEREVGRGKRWLAMWTPTTNTFSVGVHTEGMERYIFAVMGGKEVMLIGKGDDRELAGELVKLLRKVVSDKIVARVAKALGVKDGGE
jgi:hypothetical protein